MGEYLNCEKVIINNLNKIESIGTVQIAVNKVDTTLLVIEEINNFNIPEQKFVRGIPLKTAEELATIENNNRIFLNFNLKFVTKPKENRYKNFWKKLLVS